MEKTLHTKYQHGKCQLNQYSQKKKCKALLILAALQMSATTAVHAQDTVNTLETPPALTEEELSRSINSTATRVDDNTAVTDQDFDTSPGTSDVVTEYRIQQKLYLIEVKPRMGGNYFLSDSDGDGSLEEYRQRTESDANIGKWRLGTW